MIGVNIVFSHSAKYCDLKKNPNRTKNNKEEKMSASNAVLSKSPPALLSDFLSKKYEQEKTVERYIQGNIRLPTVDIHHPPH